MKKLYVLVIPLCLFLSCPCPPRQTEAKKYVKVHFIDVGHGDCIFIETHDDGDDNNNKYQGYRILIDAGKRNRGTQYVIPYLSNLGMNAGATIDYVIASHAHADHIGGLLEIYDHFQVDNTLDPGYHYTTNVYNDYYNRATNEPNSNFYHDLVTSGLITGNGDYLDWGDELQVRVLHTTPSSSGGINNTSMVIHMKYQGVSFLFMGDAEGKDRADPPSVIEDVEEYLVNTYGAELKSTVLKVGHHGSETTSTDDFIQAVQPEYAVICAGCAVFSGTILPDQTVIDRYENAGATVLRTDNDDIGKSESQAGGDDHIVLKTDGGRVFID